MYVATNSGISATQVVQLVAQKFTKATFPCSCLALKVEPSSKTKEDSGARSPEQPAMAHTKAMAQTPRHATLANDRT
jgi:hypothetical protein